MRENVRKSIVDAIQLRWRNVVRYGIKALAAVAILALIRDCAPITPAWLLPILLLVYALPAAVGSMYDVVVNRLHRQNMYNENGTLSHYNRRWVFWFGALFVFYLASALIYAIQAPSWDRQECALVWMTPLVYGIIYLIIRRLCRREYSSTYYKARAMRWSIIVSALVLTIIYAVMCGQPSTDLQIDFREIVQDRYLPFEESPAPLLAEIDKFSTYANCLSEYGLEKFAGHSYVISLLASIVSGFSVFVGVVSLLSACLLNQKELKSEFQLLPADEGGAEEPVRKQYIALLVAIWIVFSGVLWVLDGEVGKIRATSEYTAVDAWIDETTEWAILAAEQDVKTIKKDVERAEDLKKFNEEFDEKKKSFMDEQLPSVVQRVNDYYDACEANIDAYAEWYDSVPVAMARLFPIMKEGMVRDEFAKQIVESVNTEELNDQYRVFVEGLKGLYSEYWTAEANADFAQRAPHDSADEIEERLASELSLWADWNSDQGTKFVHEVLLGENAEGDSTDVRKRIRDYIEERRGETVAYVESLPNAFGFGDLP